MNPSLLFFINILAGGWFLFSFIGWIGTFVYISKHPYSKGTFKWWTLVIDFIIVAWLLTYFFTIR